LAGSFVVSSLDYTYSASKDCRSGMIIIAVVADIKEVRPLNQD
jgi:hypothetical protein